MLNVTALGNSTGTGPNGVTAEVVEVLSIEELQGLDDNDVKGKIVFFTETICTLIDSQQKKLEICD